ncbi:hypothetical protein NMK71_09820 [Weeksellaceae bacterium KMM 9713]|uniref:Outer membrane protein beta-barrel domain-containing protein n=1 Tax=Profundicola chukchiensis TaxID=2961959 RepID=A0A9X4MZ57_9FLAO|nr:hypothetical protein [Profundicola chukchiensis]MDG4946714.1 hypothetical protein [Profundicola chukchiensis]
MQDKFENKIKESLQNHEMQPPPMAWENISSALQNEKPKAKPWAKWLSIAAILIPAFVAVGIWLTNPFDVNEDSNSSIQSTEKTIVKSSQQATDVEDENTQDSVNGVETRIDNNINDWVNSDVSNKGYANNIDANSMRNQVPAKDKSNTVLRGNKVVNFFANLWSGSEVSDENKVKKESYDIFPKRRVNTLTALVSPFRNQNEKVNQESNGNNDLHTSNALDLSLLGEGEKENEVEEVKPRKRRSFEVSPYAGTAYLGSLNEASLISPEYNPLKIENKLATSYGAKASYRVNDRLKMRAGLGVIDLQQETYDVPLSVNTMDGQIRYNLKSHSNLGVDLSDHRQATATYAANELDEGKRMREGISHELQFIEVPVEVEYQLTDNKKMNMAATGGLSTLFLNKNDVYLSEQNRLFAESTNMKSVSFSANAGVKLDYAITEKVSVNVEPQVRYMINTVTANDEVQPYLLAVNAGLSIAL